MLAQFRVVHFAAALVAAFVLAFAPTPSQAQSGRVYIELVRAGFIVGVTGGSGTLTYAGKRYPLSIGGVSVGATIGASKVVLVGTARNLRGPRDIAGVYSAAGAGASVIRGARSASLRNANGVILDVRGRETGLEFSIDLSGMTISMR
jgi:hypothetical protein